MRQSTFTRQAQVAAAVATGLILLFCTRPLLAASRELTQAEMARIEGGGGPPALPLYPCQRCNTANPKFCRGCFFAGPGNWIQCLPSVSTCEIIQWPPALYCPRNTCVGTCQSYPGAQCTGTSTPWTSYSDYQCY